MLLTSSGSGSTGWKWALLALCACAFALTVAVAVDNFGAGARPWFGWWDSNVHHVAPFTVAIVQPRRAGATDRAGLNDGDRIDLREQSAISRIYVVFQLMATQPAQLVVRRENRPRAFDVTGSTIYEGAPLWKMPPIVTRVLANLFLAFCATVIALRKPRDRVARLAALVFLLVVGSSMDPTFIVVPSTGVAAGMLLAGRLCTAIALAVLVRLAAEFGERAPWRPVLERLAYGLILAGFLTNVAAAVGLVTLRFDPLPFIARIGVAHAAFQGFVCAVVGAVAAVAVARTAAVERPRAAWLLLPIPIALLVAACAATTAILWSSWFVNVAIIGLENSMRLLGALMVTYALLQRRVLDVGFVLSRTVVVATVSLIVVAAFTLLEWLLGVVLTGVSHAEGLVANAALALGLGLSLRFIHKRVDAFVDAVLFRKRHDDERALIDFSKEAAYVTQIDPLLDRTIETVAKHTDARSASMLIEDDVAYRCVRAFGDASALDVDENDAAILALKTWHRPIDPHHYSTKLSGALALPMLARGRLAGVLVLGERAGGEAYAPDEIDALSQLAYGVASALDALSVQRVDGLASLQAAVTSMAESLEGLRDALVRDIRPSV